MSLAVDLGLFLRNSKTKLGLSLTQRGILFTLAIRIGNHANTWIKQETLSLELGVEESSVRKSMSKIKATKIIQVGSQAQDKRKNTYAFSKKLINYHQMSDSEKAAVHRAFGDEFCPLKSCKLSTGKKKNQAKLRGNNGDTRQNCAVNTRQNCAVIEDEKNAESPATSTFQDIQKSPKVKVESNKKSKVKEEAMTLPDNFCPKKEALMLAESKKINVSELVKNFKQWAYSENIRSKNWDRAFMTWIETEKISERRRYSQPNEISCTVPWFNPEHASI